MTAEGERGVLLVVSAPSGAGKTTLCHRLVQEFDRLGFSISYTTRQPRGAEKNGVDYHFVDGATFEQMVEQDRLAEWAWVHDHRYGTSRESVEQALAAGRDLIFDIDWQGAVQLQTRYPDDVVTVFVVPPSMDELERRLRGRGTDSEEVIARRLEAATEELEQVVQFEFVVLNDALEQAYDDLRAVYRAAHLGQKRQAFRVSRLLRGRGGTGG
jgi:guanylate kinase